MKLAARALLVGIAPLAVVACDNPLAAKATAEVKADTVLLYAFNGTAPGAPAGLNVLSHKAVSLDGSFLFDLAFDIDGSSKAVVYPVQKVGNGLVSTNRVGLQRMGGTFANLTTAPTGGYKYDSTFVVENDAPVAVEVTDPTVCSGIYSSGVYYAKVAVLGIDTVNRLLRIAVTVDPNCGFRSFNAGVPTS